MGYHPYHHALYQAKFLPPLSPRARRAGAAASAVGTAPVVVAVVAKV